MTAEQSELGGWGKKAADQRMQFDLYRFIGECQDALAADQPLKAMREVVARTVSEPASILSALGEPRRAQIQKLYCAPELTILNLVWAPGMSFMPHNHQMWAIIGIYAGCEDNVFWRRITDDAGGRVEPAAAKRFVVKDAEPLGRDIIHSVTNPMASFTGALHVYGGDFFAAARSEWDAETKLERPYSVENTLRQFEDANASYVAAAALAGKDFK
jgi:predicted metal-dependent enzyme (double-stranded beta helix superfamily)